MPHRNKFIKPESLPSLKEDFQSIIDRCKPSIAWKEAYTRFALRWNREFGETLGRIPSHTFANSSGVFSIYGANIQEHTRAEIERIFGGIILKVGARNTPPEELGDNTSLLPEKKTWNHIDETNISNQEKKIELPTEGVIYTQFKEGFLTCDDIINPEKLLPTQQELIINIPTGRVKATRAYIERIPHKQKDVILDFILGFHYKK